MTRPLRPVLASAALALASLTIAITPAVARAAEDSAPWSYEGDTGPARWADLSATYETCGAGRMQSPIDLATANVVADVPLFVDYRSAALSARNTGRTIQVDLPEGSYLSTSGRVFELAQIHFHTPSEHAIDGTRYPLAAHFVHASPAGELAVLGVLFEVGRRHDEVQKILDAVDGVGSGVEFAPARLLPDDLEAFRYMGSLTTPPCSEGVHWHVLEEPVAASQAQIDALRASMGANARPLLPVNDRLIIAPD